MRAGWREIHMPRFWLTEERTQTIRTLVEAPSAQAVHKYYKVKDSDWDGKGVERLTHQIISAENNQRAAGLVPDVQVAADGTELDDDDPAYKSPAVDLLSPEAYAKVPMLKPRLADTTGPLAYWSYVEYVAMARQETAAYKAYVQGFPLDDPRD